MKVRLYLTIDKEIAEKAKLLTARRKTTLSKMVEYKLKRRLELEDKNRIA